MLTIVCLHRCPPFFFSNVAGAGALHSVQVAARVQNSQRTGRSMPAQYMLAQCMSARFSAVKSESFLNTVYGITASGSIFIVKYSQWQHSHYNTQ